MGLAFLPWDKILDWDVHIIVDARDGKEYRRSEHDAFEAITNCLREDIGGELARNDALNARCSYDHLRYMFSQNGSGMVMQAIGDIPEPYFEIDTPAHYIVLGPFYTLESCLHNKNLQNAVIRMRNNLREIEAKERDLTDEEQRIAVEFNTYLTVQQKGGLHDHPDHQ